MHSDFGVLLFGLCQSKLFKNLTITMVAWRSRSSSIALPCFHTPLHRAGGKHSPALQGWCRPSDISIPATTRGMITDDSDGGELAPHDN